MPVAPDSLTVLTDETELRALLGEPGRSVVEKERIRLHALDRQWLAASPFCLVATSDAQGNCDVSPKGDPPGFVHILDDTTIALPERPGNRRADGFHNVLSNPHVGLVFLIPGRGDTLRINGRARVVRDAPWFDELVVAGHRPRLALLVDVDVVFHHCGKAFMRSQLWDPATWAPEAVPPRAVVAKELERQGERMEDIERHYGPGYADGLYRES